MAEYPGLGNIFSRIKQCNDKAVSVINDAGLSDHLASHMEITSGRLFKEGQEHLISKIINSASIKALQG